MDGFRTKATYLAIGCVAAVLVAYTLSVPGVACADQSKSGDMSVFVTMEYTDEARPTSVRIGNYEQTVTVAPSPSRGAGLLPQTGDPLRFLAASSVFAGLAGLLMQTMYNRRGGAGTDSACRGGNLHEES